MQALYSHNERKIESAVSGKSWDDEKKNINKYIKKNKNVSPESEVETVKSVSENYLNSIHIFNTLFRI